MNAYEIPDAIQWIEGLLLTPQHFQQLSSRHEALVQYGTSMVAPFYWGIRRFNHQPISLTPGKFQVLQLEAVMPDGLVVSAGCFEGADVGPPAALFNASRRPGWLTLGEAIPLVE